MLSPCLKLGGPQRGTQRPESRAASHQLDPQGGSEHGDNTAQSKGGGKYISLSISSQPANGAFNWENLFSSQLTREPGNVDVKRWHGVDLNANK